MVKSVGQACLDLSFAPVTFFSSPILRKGGERFENLADMNGATSMQQSRAYFAMDFERICEETGFSKPMVSYSNHRRIPKMTSMLWHQISCAFLRGRFFSNGMALLTHKEA